MSGQSCPNLHLCYDFLYTNNCRRSSNCPYPHLLTERKHGPQLQALAALDLEILTKAFRVFCQKKVNAIVPVQNVLESFRSTRLESWLESKFTDFVCTWWWGWRRTVSTNQSDAIRSFFVNGYSDAIRVIDINHFEWQECSINSFTSDQFSRHLENNERRSLGSENSNE